MTANSVAGPALDRRAPRPQKDPTLEFELGCFAAGAALVIGVDEVGRGAVAGPVAVGAHATALGVESFPEGLRDSKLLSEKRREALAPAVVDWGAGTVGFATAAEIDERGIVWALGQAARRALLMLHDEGVPVASAVILLDGSHDWLSPVLRPRAVDAEASPQPGSPPASAPLDVRTMVGADRSCASVAAASIRAKVARDALMRAAHEEHPGYAWVSNKGYGAQAHYEGIATHGLTPLHRRSFIH